LNCDRYNSIKEARVFYTDASNLSHDGAYEVTLKADDIAKSNATNVAFNLNNYHYVETYKDEIIKLLPKVDIIIGSEKEAKNLFKAENVDAAITQYLKTAKIVIITQGKHGAIIASKDVRLHLPTAALEEKIVDLNGAGDGFISGFLYGYTHGYNLKESGELGAKVAAQIIYQKGARPRSSLRQLIS
jgi:sugar/nucleoside kinase (ribokinase family)